MAGFPPGLITPLQAEALKRVQARDAVVVQCSRAPADESRRAGIFARCRSSPETI